MNKIKGIVVEQNKESVVILTPDGRFIRGEAEGQKVGSEIQTTPVRPKSRLHLSSVRKPVAALLAAALLILLSGLFLPFREPALAFIQLEVNPAVEFGIDSEGKVLELTPLNDDGASLISEFGEWDGKSATELIGRIFAKYGESEREMIVTSVVGTDRELAATIKRTVHFIKEEAAEEGMLLKFSEADREIRDRAMTQGVPISRLIHQDNQSGDPSSSKHDQKKTDGTEMPSPAENRSNPESVDRSDQDTRPKAAEKESVQPPGNSGQAPGILKKETTPPASGKQAKPAQKPKPPVQPKEEGQKNPAGGPSENGLHNGKPKESGKPDKASQQNGTLEQGNRGNPPEHAGQDKKSPPPGHAGQDKQSVPPSHAGPKPGERPSKNPAADRGAPSEKPDSPGQGQSSNTSQPNKNSGNGKGGNGNGPGK